MMTVKYQSVSHLSAPIGAFLYLGISGCTGSLPEAFRFQQQTETFSSQTKVNTKIDLLWVVDNSASMDVSQDALRNGFQGFANTYLKPYWDIKIAVITTDLYLADPSFWSGNNTYLNRVITGSNTWTVANGTNSNYIKTIKNSGPWVSSFSSSYYNLVADPTNANGEFLNGLKFGQLVPVWGPNYSLLKAGIHDGPITGLCFEQLPYFYAAGSEPKCQSRDAKTNTGITSCVSPNTGAGESSINQCVNTVRNDTVRSGKPILFTKPTDPNTDLVAWQASLINNFKVNASKGSVGNGSERGFESLHRFLTDNEATNSPTQFFRQGSLRGIIFITDEDDQSITIPTTGLNTLEPFSNYYCDQPTLPMQPGDASGNPVSVTAPGGYCCAGGTCRYLTIPDAGIPAVTTCPVRRFNAATGAYDPAGATQYRVSLCPDPRLLKSVASYKAELDNFFGTLDSDRTNGPLSYFVSAIVPTTINSINTLQAARKTIDGNVGGVKIMSADYPSRYVDLVTQVGNGSSVMDILGDYSVILNTIGTTIVQKKGVFPLARAPTGTEDMLVYRVNTTLPNGKVVVTQTQANYVVQGTNLVFQDVAYVLSLSENDSIAVNYQPKSAF